MWLMVIFDIFTALEMFCSKNDNGMYTSLRNRVNFFQTSILSLKEGPLKEVVHHPRSRFLSFSVLLNYAFTRVISSLWAQTAVFVVYNNCRVLHLPFLYPKNTSFATFNNSRVLHLPCLITTEWCIYSLFYAQSAAITIPGNDQWRQKTVIDFLCPIPCAVTDNFLVIY